ncbi:MAG: AbrB/MazE/SpoVT family DNA-binding domain-containing protein [Methanosarcinales archaeon]
MHSAGTYKMTKQGQIILPKVIIEEMKLKEGNILDFYYSDDIIVIKKKKEPIEVFKELAKTTRKRFLEKGISEDDVEKEIMAYRAEKND